MPHPAVPMPGWVGCGGVSSKPLIPTWLGDCRSVITHSTAWGKVYLANAEGVEKGAPLVGGLWGPGPDSGLGREAECP